MDAAKVGKLQDDRNKLPTNGENEEDSPVNSMTDEEFDRIIASLRGDMEDFGFELSIDDVPEPDTVPEYRILKVGELIQQGDELYNEFDNEWIETSFLTSEQIKVVNNTIYRRKITDCDLKEDPSIKYRVETVAYRKLEKDERLQDGDEVYVGEDHWLPVYVADWITPAIVRNGTYRRKITDCDLKDEPKECTVKTFPRQYEYLDEGEPIQKGDEYYSDVLKKWTPATLLFECVPSSSFYRRPIKSCCPKLEPQLDGCKCGKLPTYSWLMGFLCEDCELKYSDPYETR
jgi:hypothetical protein